MARVEGATPVEGLESEIRGQFPAVEFFSQFVLYWVEGIRERREETGDLEILVAHQRVMRWGGKRWQQASRYVAQRFTRGHQRRYRETEFVLLLHQRFRLPAGPVLVIRMLLHVEGSETREYLFLF